MVQHKKLSPFEEKLNQWFIARLTRVGLIHKIFFFEHLRIMLHAGLSLSESLSILHKETEQKKMKSIITDVLVEVESGKQLSAALASHEKQFPSMYIKMIASGETAGTLEEALEHIVTQMKKNHELNSNVRGALIYPAVILSAVAVVGILMTTVVLPKLIVLFEEFETDLPLSTRILIYITHIFSSPLYLSIAFTSVTALVIAFFTLLKKSTSFKKIIHSINLKLPILGTIIQHINLARFSLTLSSLLKSTIPIVEAVDISADTCGNLLYRETLKNTAVRIKKGEPLSQVLSSFPALYPPMVTEMILVGERSGEVNRLLGEIADYYGDEVDKTMKNMSTIIEPVIIIILGIIVAGVALAVVMPMFNLIQNF